MNRYMLFLTFISILLPNQIWENFKSKVNIFAYFFKSKSTLQPASRPKNSYPKEFIPESNINKIYFYDKVKLKMKEGFESRFDIISYGPNYFHNRSNTEVVKNLCNTSILNFFNKISYNNEEAMLEAARISIIREGSSCLGSIAQAKIECENKHQDKTIRKNLGKEAKRNTIDTFYKGTPGGLEYLFDKGPLKEEVLKKAKKLCLKPLYT